MPPGIGYRFPTRPPGMDDEPFDFRFREQTHETAPGLRFNVGQGGELDFSEVRPVRQGGGGIPDSLRRSAFGADDIRPLLQGNSDGSPMSMGDLQSRQNAMDALDEFFTVRPALRNAELSALEAETTRNESLAEDPLALERGKLDLDLQRRMFEFDQKARVEREGEEARRGAFGSELQQMERDAQAEIEAARAEGDEAGARAIEAMLDQQRQNIREKFGIGAKLGAAGLYRQDF